MSIQQLFFSSSAADQITATGGSITTNGDYKLHAFYTSGTFTLTSYQSSSYPILVFICPGGGGGSPGIAGDQGTLVDGGDGGAGGYGGDSTYYPSTWTTGGLGLNSGKTVIVGAGAVGGVQFGSDSSFAGTAASGGLVTNGSGGYGGLSGSPGSNGGDAINDGLFNTTPFISGYYGAGGGGGGGGGYAETNGGDGGAGGNPDFPELGAGGGGGAGTANVGNSGGTGANGEGGKGQGGGGGGGGGGGLNGPGSGGTPGNGGAGIVMVAYKFRNN